jgi:hypothetical protein
MDSDFCNTEAAREHVHVCFDEYLLLDVLNFGLFVLITQYISGLHSFHQNISCGWKANNFCFCDESL